MGDGWWWRVVVTVRATPGVSVDDDAWAMEAERKGAEAWTEGEYQFGRRRDCWRRRGGMRRSFSLPVGSNLLLGAMTLWIEDSRVSS